MDLNRISTINARIADIEAGELLAVTYNDEEAARIAAMARRAGWTTNVLTNGEVYEVFVVERAVAPFDQYELSLVVASEDPKQEHTLCETVEDDVDLHELETNTPHFMGFTWSLYGRTKGIATHIVDFRYDQRDDAVELLQRITGKRVESTSRRVFVEVTR
jgi:hypothetical protein